MKKLLKLLVLFGIGGSIYITIEMIWRAIRGSSPTHWSMFILGGLCLLLIGSLNEWFKWHRFWVEVLAGTGIVLLLEFLFGYILNIRHGLNIWDYSEVPGNIMGQICLPFAFAWAILVAIAIVLDDYLRCWLFKEEPPDYLKRKNRRKGKE